MTIIAAADGSALGNPGPAGWGWFVDDKTWASGGWPHGTNNMGELMAVLDLLQQSAHLDEDLLVYCDSTYVINSITKWMPGWKRKGWKKGDGKPVQNVELMKALDAAMQGRRVRFEWVKGHAGHELNEAADALANSAALAYQSGGVPNSGPGFAGSSVEHPDAQVGQTIETTDHELDLFSGFDFSDADEAVEVALADPIAEVVALERSLLTDDVRADPAEVARLLRSDWSEVGQSGRIWSREEMLDEIAPLTAPATLDIIEARSLSDDIVLLLWRSSADDGSAVRSSLWVRGTAGWQQAFHQATPEV